MVSKKHCYFDREFALTVASQCILRLGSHRKVQLFFISYHSKIGKQRQGIHVHTETQTHGYTHTQAPCKPCLFCIIPDIWSYRTWTVLLAEPRKTSYHRHHEASIWRHWGLPECWALRNLLSKRPRTAFTSNVALASSQLHNTEHMLGLKFHQLSKQTTRSSCGPRVATRWEVSPSCNIRDVYAQVLGSRPSVSSQETKWKDHWHPKPSHWRTPIIATSECLKGQEEAWGTH